MNVKTRAKNVTALFISIDHLGCPYSEIFADIYCRVSEQICTCMHTDKRMWHSAKFTKLSDMGNESLIYTVSERLIRNHARGFNWPHC